MIQIDHLTKTYGRARGVTDLTLHVPEGGCFGFIGPNGAGKSTTIRTLLGLLSPTAGAARVLGLDCVRQRNAILAQVGYMPSEAMFYPDMRVGQVIRLSAGLRKKDCRAQADALCETLELDARKRIRELSLGNRKKVSIVCAMQHRPRLYILDEPTSGLDPSGAVLFRKIIEQERKKGTTVFVTTHNMVDADLLCDRVAFISNGNLVALDTPKRLKEKNSNHRVVIDYLYQGQRETKTIEAPELEAGIPFAHDEIISIHSKEPTLEDMFIQYTGRGLS